MSLQEKPASGVPPTWDKAGGIPLLANLRQASPLTRIVVYTAYKGTEEDKGFYAAKAGADAYLGKVKVDQNSVEYAGFKTAFQQRVRDELAQFEELYYRKYSKK